MILSNLVKKSKRRTILCLARPRFESDVYTHTKFDLSELSFGGWIDTDTEIHLYHSCGTHAVDDEFKDLMLGSYSASLRYSNNTAETDFVISDPDKINDGISYVLNVAPLVDVKKHPSYQIERIKSKYGVRHTILNVRCTKTNGDAGESGVGALLIPTQTKNIQTVYVHQKYGDMFDPTKTPLNCLVQIDSSGIEIRLEKPLTEMYVQIVRGNTPHTIMDGLLYKGSEEFNISVTSDD